MVKEQRGRNFTDPTELRERTIPPDFPSEGRKPIAAAGFMADLDPAPVTPRPWEEEMEIARQAERSARPPHRRPAAALWVATGLIVAVGLIVVVGALTGTLVA